MPPRGLETGTSGRTGRILIVEDETLVARDLEDQLVRAGYDVVGVVSRAAPALAIARHVALDLALVDIELAGGEDGVALAAQLDVPVIFVSGHADDETLARVREVGAAGFVVKPFSERQLLVALDLALTRAPAPGRDLAQAQRALSDIARALEAAGIVAPERTLPAPKIRSVPGLDGLSRREREVLDQLLLHRRPPQIARALAISPHTVRNHLKAIFAKLGVHSQAELLELLVVPAPSSD